jgi:hypothetical protein
LPALIFDVPPDPDGDVWAFAHILEPNRMAFEFTGSGDLEPVAIFAGSLDEGGGPIKDIVINASPAILPFVRVRIQNFRIWVYTTEPVTITEGVIEATIIR